MRPAKRGWFAAGRWIFSLMCGERQVRTAEHSLKIRCRTANETKFTSQEVMMKLHPASTPLLICLLSLLVVITAVAFTKQQGGQLANLTDGELKAVVIQFERTGCYGNCPADKVRVYGDGRAGYQGKK